MIVDDTVITNVEMPPIT